MSPPLLEARDLQGGYGRLRVLRGVSLQVRAGEIVLLLGRNGSGRSTLLQILMGLLPGTGSLWLAGHALHTLPSHRRARLGLGYVPEQRDIFPGLSVRQNLALGAKPGADPSLTPWTEAHVLVRFPALAARLHTAAHHLSGGEQQMLALARTLLGNPRLLLLDEPTQGLAPQRVAETAELLTQLRATGLGILLVEQRPWALDLADRVVVLGDQQVQFSGAPACLPSAVSDAWL